MIVLVCGDRYWVNRARIARALAKLPKDTEIIHGACEGADEIAGEEAKKLGLKVREFPADWDNLGKKAGPIRNRKMLDEKPTFVMAFHNTIEASKGTIDTMREAKRRGIRVLLLTTEKSYEY